MFQRRIPPEVSQEADHLASEVVNAVVHVRRALGAGLSEEIYKRALAIELGRRGIHHEREKQFDVVYETVTIGHARPDFIIGAHLVLEAKAARELAPIDFAQTMTYLRAPKRPLGLLVNFHAVPLGSGIRRVVPG